MLAHDREAALGKEIKDLHAEIVRLRAQLTAQLGETERLAAGWNKASDEVERLRAENTNYRVAVPKWGYPNHPGVAGPCEFEDGSKWDGFNWVRPPSNHR